MGQAKRLSSLQVRVTRYQGVAMLISLTKQGPLQTQQITIHFIKTASQPEPQISAHLIIPTAAGVKLLADGPEQSDQTTLNSEVDILIGQSRVELPL